MPESVSEFQTNRTRTMAVGFELSENSVLTWKQT